MRNVRADALFPPPLVRLLLACVVLAGAGGGGVGCSKRPAGAPGIPAAAPAPKKAAGAGTRAPSPAATPSARGTGDLAADAAGAGAVGPSAGSAGSGGRPRPGYDRLVEDLTVDASVLRGRRIALDPGHGGRFPGSVGIRGLTEAEVNLGVALHLWGLLTDAGAEVFLTRTADRDFKSPADSSLRFDLAERVERVNAFGPEAFISIHHNADAGGRNDQNEIQTYYKFSDPDASYDLALALHRHLKTNLAIDADRIIPGNFFVIRNSNAAAVLGESSYLTNPDVEKRLELAAKQRLEAEAYFLGLVTYFRQGVPRILAMRVEPATGIADSMDADERPRLVVHTDRAPGTARLALDGAPVDTATIVRAILPGGGWALSFRPTSPLTDGRHVATWSVRAVGGNWSKVASDTFEVALPVARVELEVAPRAEAARGQIVGLALRALDRHGRAVSDTVVARFTSRVGAVVVDSLAPGTASPGEARAYARITGGSTAAFTARVLRPAVRPDLAEVERTAPLGAPGSTRVVTGFARAGDGIPVAGARVSAGPGDTAFAMTNAEGFFAVARAGVGPGAGAATTQLQAIAPGYVTAADAKVASGSLRMLPVASGVLRGRRIAIDPGGGGADTTGKGADSTGRGAMTPTAAGGNAGPANPGGANGALEPAGPGTAAADSVAPEFLGTDTLASRRALVFEADANLRVACALREYLEAAGAAVRLTRDGPESLTSVERLRRTEAFAPERVLVIGHRQASGATLGHYFSSAGGKALAGRIARRFEKRGIVGRAGVAETGNYVVAQTAAVAVTLNGPRAEPLDVDPTRGARRLREEAYAIYLALAEDFGADADDFVSLSVSVTRAGEPATNVPVELDGRWILLSDMRGKVRFDGLPAGANVSVAAGDRVATSAAARAIHVTLPHRGEVSVEASSGTLGGSAGGGP